jgi:hypothetical protein
LSVLIASSIEAAYQYTGYRDFSWDQLVEDDEEDFEETD